MITPVDLHELNRQPLQRLASFDYATAARAKDEEGAEESRSLEFPFSSEQPVERWFGAEVLSHADGAMDMTRLNDGAVCRISLGRPVNIGRDGVQRFPHGAADSRLTRRGMVR